MHCLEIGPAGQAAATVLFDSVYEDFTGTKAEKLEKLMVVINQEYDALGIKDGRIRKLAYSHFCSADRPFQECPDIMHSAIKARQCRYLVPVAANICKRAHKPGDAYSRHKLQCLENLATYYDITDLGAMHLDKKDAEQAERALHGFVVNYAACAKLSADAGLNKWPIKPKLHFVAHIADEIKYINPSVVYCYAGESMVGSVTSLAQACLSGLPAHKVPETVCTKYRVGKHLQFDPL